MRLALLWVVWCYLIVYCKGLCIFTEHAQYIRKECSHAQQWICFNPLRKRHNTKSTSPTNCRLKTWILTTSVNEIHLQYFQSPCRAIIESNSEVWNIKIFGPYAYVCTKIKQFLRLWCEHILVNTWKLMLSLVIHRANQHQVTSSTHFTFYNTSEPS